MNTKDTSSIEDHQVLDYNMVYSNNDVIYPKGICVLVGVHEDQNQV